jgi:hypothetical protein
LAVVLVVELEPLEPDEELDPDDEEEVVDEGDSEDLLVLDEPASPLLLAASLDVPDLLLPAESARLSLR